MAITNVTYGMEYFARSVVRGKRALETQITDGMIPESVAEEIKKFIVDSVEANEGVVPTNLYRDTALKISPYSSLPISNIETILAATNFFGLTGKAPNVSTVGSGGYSKRAETQKKVSAREQKVFGVTQVDANTTSDNFEIVSPLDGAANAMMGMPRGSEVEIVTPYQEFEMPEPFQLGGDNIAPGGSTVCTAEEFEAEMSSVTRQLSEIIVHFSETYQNANLNKDQTPGGSKYHYIIHRDGSCERGVPVNATGSHTPKNGHNAYSIGICLVGGLSAASGEDNPETTVDAGSITRQQYNTMHAIFDAFYRIWPGGQALGHSEIDPTQKDPGFDVRDYVFAKFGKISLYEKPEEESALSVDDILERVAGNEGSPILDKDPDVEKKYQ